MDCLLGRDPSEVGYHTWDIIENRLSLDRVCAAMCGVPEAEGAEGIPIEAFLMKIDLANRERVAKAIHDSLLYGNFYQEEYPVEHEPGLFRLVRVGGRLIYDRDGVPLRGIGWMVDVSPEKILGEGITRQ